MKRIGDLWPRVIAFDNLVLAWRKARRGKRRRAPVAAFGLGLERELFNLQAQLERGDWRPGPYRLFTVYERKPRLIAAAPFRDRVVHHALMNVIEPRIDRRFIHDCYACRRNKGVHAAVDRYQGWARRHVYVLKMDIEKYGSSGQFVGGSEPVRAWVPVDLWITSLLPTGSTGQAGDLWTTSLLPTDPQPYRECDDRTARGAGRLV